jgi:AsmA protein
MPTLNSSCARASPLLNRKTLSGAPRGKDTPFKALKGSLVFRNGVASNPDLIVRIPGMSVKGDGDIDLRVLGMDYRIGITVEGDKSAMPDPACQVGKNFVGYRAALALPWPAGTGRQGLPSGQGRPG